MAEKEEKKKPADGAAPGTAPPKSKKKLLMLAGIGLVAVVAIGLAVFFVFKPSGADAGKDNTTTASREKEGEKGGHAGGKEGGKEGEKAGVNPLFFPMEPFILNLADVESNRYLKISITVEFSEPKTSQEAAGRTPQIRDALVLLMSSLTYGDIHSVEGKLTLQSEIQNRVNKIMAPGTVKRVYFTDLVVQ